MKPLFLLPFVAWFFAGCAGYHIGPVKPKIMADVQTVAIPSFKNDTLEPRIEVPLATALIKQIQQDGTYRVVNENEADVIVKGTLEEIRRRPARSVRGNTLATKEFTLQLKCRYQVIKRATGVVIDARAVTGQTSFFVSGSDSISSDVNQDERQAIPLAAEDMAIQLVSLISEGW